jgi:hypothetical protein
VTNACISRDLETANFIAEELNIPANEDAEL